MKNVTITLPFRDNADDTITMFNLIYDLDWPKDHLRVVAVEGDSVDDTYDMLTLWRNTLPAEKVTIVKLDLGVPKYPSMVHPVRFKALAETYNRGLDESVADGWTDYTLFMPSDLDCFDPNLVSSLISHDKPYIAPMYWIKIADRPIFYDTWGYQDLEGENWVNFDQRNWAKSQPKEPFEMRLVGGSVMIRRDVLEAGCRYCIKTVDHGMCRSVRAKGFSIWCDPSSHIYHRGRDS